MQSQDTASRYQEVSNQLQALTGLRVRLAYPNGFTQTGEVETRDFGHTIDVRVGLHGGMLLEDVVSIEVMQPNGRYTPCR